MSIPQVGPQKPGMVTAIAVMTLVSGILNIMYGLGLTASIVLGTFGIGLLCAPFTILPLILGIFEILYATKILPDPIQRVKPNQTIAILEICTILTGEVISTVIGILVLVFYNDPAVKAYFAQINNVAVAPPYPVAPTLANQQSQQVLTSSYTAPPPTTSQPAPTHPDTSQGSAPDKSSD